MHQDLVRLVADELEKRSSCKVSNDELRKIWPDAEKRRHQIARFAKDHNWFLLSYNEDDGAIFYRRN